MAYGYDVHVWVPNGPYQLLGSQAEMIIHPVMKETLASGYIDRSSPHTINAVVVDDLGRDEVFLLVTDSGNICGYNVEAIYSAIDRCAKSGYKRPFDGSEVSPFFVENVGMSAWGLATHKFARLIAVSANTGQITVFAFALVDPAGNSDESFGSSEYLDVSSDQTWVSIENRRQLRELRQLMPHNHRSRNLRLTYRGHFDNIPCVSFANFDLDADGRWMVSTDINNRVILWRIWDDLWPSAVYYPGHPMNNPPQRGWSVIPLDPRTFRQHWSREAACGCQPGSSHIATRTVLDLSRMTENIPNSSQVFATGSNPPEAMSPLLIPEDLVVPDSRIDSGSLQYYSDSDSERPPSALGQSMCEARYGSTMHLKFHPRRTEDDAESDRFLRPRTFTGLFDEDNALCQRPSQRPSLLLQDCLYTDVSGVDLNILKSKPVHRKYPYTWSTCVSIFKC